MKERLLRSRHPVDVRRTLLPLRRGVIDPCMRLERDEAVRATRTPEGPATLHIQGSGTELRATAWGPGADWALEHAPALLGFDDDPSSFAPLDPAVAQLHRSFPGIRIGRSDGVMEVLVPTILEQKVTGHEARRSYAALVRRYGEPAPGPGDLYVPPAPSTLAEVPYWAWHRAGVEQRRARTIRHACTYARRLEETLSLPAPEMHARLVTLPGIGDWTGAHVTMLAAGDPDAVFVGDYHIPHLVSWTLAGEPRGSDARMLELLEPFRGHRARVVRLIEAGGARPERRAPRKALRSIARI